METRGISKAFGGLQALSDVDLSVPTGSIVGLIGSNGAGKTTLFNVISGLLAPDSGDVCFDGQSVTGTSAAARAGLGIGRSFQNLGLMTGETVRFNLLAAQHRTASYRSWELAARPRRWWRGESSLEQRADAALERFGLVAQRNTIVGELSFGVARFVELAAVLVQEPRLMLLDEPTTGLAPNETDRLRSILTELRAAGTTVLVVAHDVRFTMAICDTVYVLAEGRVIAAGEPAEIASNTAVIESYLGART